ncbi:MAG: DUF896 domain-containing protein [Ruminococcus sp.]|nr:DUF896 domain-containing protein [Ruminococcus sp.]
MEKQAALRLAYRQAVVGNLRGQLDQITVVDPAEPQS